MGRNLRFLVTAIEQHNFLGRLMIALRQTNLGIIGQVAAKGADGIFQQQ